MKAWLSLGAFVAFVVAGSSAVAAEPTGRPSTTAAIGVTEKVHARPLRIKPVIKVDGQATGDKVVKLRHGWTKEISWHDRLGEPGFRQDIIKDDKGRIVRQRVYRVDGDKASIDTTTDRLEFGSDGRPTSMKHEEKVQTTDPYTPYWGTSTYEKTATKTHFDPQRTTVVETVKSESTGEKRPGPSRDTEVIQSVSTNTSQGVVKNEVSVRQPKRGALDARDFRKLRIVKETTSVDGATKRQNEAKTVLKP